MILGYEDPVLMPTMDIYSTDLMRTYIAGVKDLYDKGQEEYKDFMKAYLDFYSPIAGDTEAYYNYTIGGALKLLDLFYQNGIDPFKSREGRAAITRYINSVPVGALNAMKQNAENRKAYDKAKAELAAKGLYNPGYEDYRLKSLGLDNFSTVDPNTGQIRVWDRYSPDVYSGVFDTTNEWFKGLEDSYMGKTSDGRYNIFGVGTDQMAPILNLNLPDYLDTPLGAYNYELFKRTLDPETTPDLALNLFKDFIMAANSRVRHLTIKEDPYMLDSVRTQNDIRSHSVNAATDHYYWNLEHSDQPNNNGIPSNKSEHYSYFTSVLNNSWGQVGGLLKKHGYTLTSNGYVRSSDGRVLLPSVVHRFLYDQAKPGLHSYDIFGIEGFPESFTEGVSMSHEDIKRYIFSMDDIDRRTTGYTGNNSGRIIDRQKIKDFIDKYSSNLKFVQNGTTSVIKAKNGNYEVFVEVVPEYTSTTNTVGYSKDKQNIGRIALKVGEFEQDEAGNLIPTYKWGSRMEGLDHSISNIGGSAVNVTNVQ